MSAHSFVEVDRDENDDRTRTMDRCSCGAIRYGCLPKRLHDGSPAWGELGVGWHYSFDYTQATGEHA